MSFTFPNKAAAEDAATKWSLARKGMPVRGAENRTISRYIVGKYPMPDGKEYDKVQDFRFDWGVVERWTYDDRPDLGEFGGGFVWYVEA